MVRGPSCIRSRQIHPPPSRVPRAIFSLRTTLHRTATLFGHLPHLLVVPGTAHRPPDVARARVRHHTARASFMLCCADARAAVGRQVTKRAATFFCLLSFRRYISKARSLFFALLARGQTVEQYGRIRQESGGTGHHRSVYKTSLYRLIQRPPRSPWPRPVTRGGCCPPSSKCLVRSVLASPGCDTTLRPSSQRVRVVPQRGEPCTSAEALKRRCIAAVHGPSLDRLIWNKALRRSHHVPVISRIWTSQRA